MRRASWLAAVSLIGLAVSVPAGAQSMSDALTKAYLTNPTLLSERAKLRATDENVPQALSGWRPTVSLSYDAGRGQFYSNATTTSTRTTTRSTRSGTVTITENLYKGGRTVAATKQAENQVLAERARLASTEQQVLLQAATAYMDVVRDQAVLELNINNQHVLERQLEATRDQFQVGEVTRTDVAQAESRLSGAISDVTAASGTLLNSRANYRNAVGDLPGKLKTAPPLGDLPATEQETLALARDKNPDVIAARYDERAAQDQVKIVYGQFLPTLDLQGTLQRNDNTSFRNSRTEEAVADAIVKLPLYQAGLVSSQVRAAKETVSQRRKDLERIVRSTLQSATQAWESLQTARSQIKSFSEQVRAAQIALEGVRQEAQVGSRTVLDVLNAEQELLTAQVNLVKAQHDEVVGSFTLRSAVGTLLASNLGLKTELYDPTKHYDSVRDRWLPFDTGIKDQ